MTIEEARNFLKNLRDTVNVWRDPGDVYAWKYAAEILDSRIMNEKPENVISIIQEVGFVRGMEFAIFSRKVAPFKEENKTFVKSSEAWQILLDDFLQRAERGRYGIE